MKKLILTILVVITISPLVTRAQAPAPTYIPLEPLPCIPSEPSEGNPGVRCPGGAGNFSGPDGAINFETYVQYIVNLIIAIAAAAAVFMIVLGGFQYMTTDSWTGKTEGLKKFKDALIGLLLVLTSYMILRIIDPRLVQIPTTLVKPLAIPSTSVDLSYMDSNLDAQAREYLAQNTAAKQIVLDLQVEKTKMVREKADIEAEILAQVNEEGFDSTATIEDVCGSRGITQTAYPEMYERCQRLRQLENTIATTDTKARLEIARGVISHIVGNCLNRSTIDVQSCNDEIDKWQKTNAGLVLEGQSSQAITDYGNYTKAVVDMNFRLKNFYGKSLGLSDYGQIIYSSNAYLNNIDNNSELKTKFIQERNAAILKLGGTQKNIDDGIYLNAYNNQGNRTNIPRNTPSYGF